MGSQKHTPTPWRAPFLNDDDSEISITDDDQMFGIAVVHEKYSESKEAMKANTKLILKSVNSHQKLVDFLKTVVAETHSEAALRNIADDLLMEIEVGQ